MEYLENKKMYEGTKTFMVGERARVKISSPELFTVYNCDSEGERTGVCVAGAMGSAHFKPQSEFICVDVPKKARWYLEYVNREMLQEKLDPEPIAIPVGTREVSMDERIREVIRQEKLMASDRGYETFEESNDFETDDEFDEMPTPWEQQFDDAQDMVPENELDYDPELNQVNSEPESKETPEKSTSSEATSEEKNEK